MLLTPQNYNVEISERTARAKNARFAVAFWGEGAVEELGLDTRKYKIKVLCNLSMGGTNPSVIERLIELGHDIRHSDTLHAKVFLFGSSAIVGSANVSANGLGFEGNAASGWEEIGVLVDDASTLTAIDKWFARQFERGEAVDGAVLKRAWERWKRRRDQRPPDPSTEPFPDLLTALRDEPDRFVDREFYLTVDVEGLDEKGERALGVVHETLGDSYYIWQSWPEIPPNATFVNFWDEHNSFTFEDFYVSDDAPNQSINGVLVQVVRQVRPMPRQLRDVSGASKLGAISAWRKVLSRIKSKRFRRWKRDNGLCLKLDELQPYL